MCHSLYDAKTGRSKADTSGAMTVIKLLLEARIATLSPNKSGWIPLHHACRSGSDDVVRLLTWGQKKSEVNQQNR